MSFDTSSADLVDDDRGLGTGGEASEALKRRNNCKCFVRFLSKTKKRNVKYLFTTFVDADRPFSIPCPGTAGFVPFAAKFGRCMRAGLAVTARLDLGPTEVARGITRWKNETEKQNQRNSGGDVLYSTPLPDIQNI